jgi:hypothetical protein
MGKQVIRYEAADGTLHSTEAESDLHDLRVK